MGVEKLFRFFFYKVYNIVELKSRSLRHPRGMAFHQRLEKTLKKVRPRCEDDYFETQLAALKQQ